MYQNKNTQVSDILCTTTKKCTRIQAQPGVYAGGGGGGIGGSNPPLDQKNIFVGGGEGWLGVRG